MTPERWRQITGVFHAALLRDSAARQPFLTEACAGDEALRAEVEAMLAAHDNAGEPGHIPAVAMSEEMPCVQPGSSLGPYRIDVLIGSGGMGQVYRARDSRIGRDVAIKLLPSDYAADAERLRRFEQEARASGALNHPNVLTLYDVGSSDGRPYLVMELLDGETLRDRIGRGAMTTVKACEITAAIARGLSAAHAKGIVHRDLKPENVMITRDGRVKILDFGIAKLRNPGHALDAPTVTTPLHTAANTILGTAGYMAPEQIRGGDADERADLFALGAILFELLTGRRAFDRPTRVETLNAILHDDAPALSAASQVPPTLDRIVQRCLEKDPDARFQSARDLAFALDTSRGLAASTFTEAAPMLVRRRFDWRTLAVAVLLIAGTVSLVIWRSRSASVTGERALARFTLPPPPRLQFEGSPAISPDGTVIVFAASEGPIETRRLFFRRLDQLRSVALPGTEGGDTPLFSPDGKSIAFWADDKLKRTSVDATSSPVVLCAVELFLGGTWTPDGTIIFGSINHGLQRVPADGGVPQPLTTLDRSKSEIDHHTPRVLPGGRALLLTVHQPEERFRIDVLTLATGARRALVDDGFDPEYSSNGRLVYGAGTALFVVPFDLDRLAVAGPSVKFLDGVATNTREGVGNFALSTTGTLVFRPQPSPPHRTVVWADRSGVTTTVPIEPRTYWTPRLSPDAQQFAVVVEEEGRRNIWIYRFDNRTFRPLTSEGLNWAPVWTRDSMRMAYLSRRDGIRHLMWQAVDGSAGAESLLSSQSDDLVPGGWSADGRSLIYVDSPPTDNSEIRVLPIEGRQAETLSGIPARSIMPVLSRDGRWLVFNTWPSGASRRPDIYVRPFPGPGPLRQIAEGAGNAVWSQDGERLLYRSRRGSTTALSDGIFELPFDRVRGIAAGPARQLFRKRFSDWLDVPGFDVAPDGRLLLVLPDESESVPSEMNVLLHVDDELRRRVR